MKTLKPGLIISIIAFLFVAAFFFNQYRSHEAPAVALRFVLSNWRPGYHSKAFDFWDKSSNYLPLYKVTDFKIIEKKIKGSRSKIAVSLNYVTGHKDKIEGIYTFYLKKTDEGWRVSKYHEGFADQKRR